MAARERVGREASTAGIVDSQSIKTTEAGGPRGYDAGTKINGRKRHLVTDTDGLPLALVVHPANVQDRDGLDRHGRRRHHPAPYSGDPPVTGC
jgi:putative transposase